MPPFGLGDTVLTNYLFTILVLTTREQLPTYIIVNYVPSQAICLKLYLILILTPYMRVL